MWRRFTMGHEFMAAKVQKKIKWTFVFIIFRTTDPDPARAGVPFRVIPVC